ncbi:MAG: oligosaccharide flippase family protein [Pseudomonadales bacterium]|nr:oligosaccharide flippase family protein [Pseudomonadales bacterium]
MRRLTDFAGVPGSLRRDLLSAISGTLGIRVVNMALAVATSIIVARSLGVEAYGSYAFVMSIIGTLALVCYIGLPELMVREIAKFDQNQQWGLIGGLLRSCYLFLGVVFIPVVILIAGLGLVFATEAELDIWRLLLIALPLVPVLALITIQGAAFRGFRMIVSAAIPAMIVHPAMFLFALLFFAVATVEEALLMQLAAATCGLAVSLFWFRIRIQKQLHGVSREYDYGAWKSALLPFIGIAGVSFFNVEFINLLLGFLGSHEDMAVFRTAANIALVVALPLTLVETAISPYITRLYQANELAKLQKMVQLASFGALLASLVPGLLLLMFGDDVIRLLYGNEFVIAYETLVVIVVGYLIVNLVGLSMRLLYATDYQDDALSISAWGAVVTVIICIFLIPVFGAFGAGVVLGFGKALRAGLFVMAARRRLGIKTSLLW